MVAIIVNFFFLIMGLEYFLLVNKKYSNVINHSSIFTIVWLFVIIGSQISGYVILTLDTLLVVYLSWYFFLLGSNISNSIKNIPSETIKVISLDKIKISCYVLVILSVLANLEILRDVFFNFSSFEVWAKMRNDQAFSEYRDNNYFYTIFGTSSNIYLPLSIYLFMEKKVSKFILFLIYTVSILIAVAAFTRAPMLYILIISIVFYSIYGKKIPYKLILISFSVLVLLFGISSFLISEVSQYNIDTDAAINLYIYGGIASYQNLLHGKYYISEVFGSNYYSFDFINYILKTIGVISSYPDLVREYDQEFNTNVYTYLDCFTLDFGFIGAFMGSFILGYIGKIVYLRYYTNHSIFDLIIYCSVCYFSSFIFMNNEFIRFGVLLLLVKVFIIEFLTKFKFRLTSPTL